MGVWITTNYEVCGEIHCRCSECDWDDWQTPFWWKNYARHCPYCGSRMTFKADQKET
jgi:hypothetical protein